MQPQAIKTDPEKPIESTYSDLLQDLTECYWIAEGIVSSGGGENVLKSLNSNQLATLRHCVRKTSELKGFLKAIR